MHVNVKRHRCNHLLGATYVAAAGACCSLPGPYAAVAIAPREISSKVSVSNAAYALLRMAADIVPPGSKFIDCFALSNRQHDAAAAAACLYQTTAAACNRPARLTAERAEQDHSARHDVKAWAFYSASAAENRNSNRRWQTVCQVSGLRGEEPCAATQQQTLSAFQRSR